MFCMYNQSRSFWYPWYHKTIQISNFLQVPVIYNLCKCQVDSPKADTPSKTAHDAEPSTNPREGMFLFNSSAIYSGIAALGGDKGVFCSIDQVEGPLFLRFT